MKLISLMNVTAASEPDYFIAAAADRDIGTCAAQYVQLQPEYTGASLQSQVLPEHLLAIAGHKVAMTGQNGIEVPLLEDAPHGLIVSTCANACAAILNYFSLSLSLSLNTSAECKGIMRMQE